MLYDPKLEERLDAKGSHVQTGAKLAPTLSEVKKESSRLATDKEEYKNLLQELAKSDFVKEMKALRASVIE